MRLLATPGIPRPRRVPGKAQNDAMGRPGLGALPAFLGHRTVDPPPIFKSGQYTYYRGDGNLAGDVMEPVI